MLRSPTYGNIVGTLALFIALGGTSYAVTKLPRNSVGSVQVRDGSLTATDLAPGASASGARGPRGALGPPGALGEAGPRGQQGPSDVITAARTGIALPAGNAALDVVTLNNVPAGKWWIMGSGSAVYEGAGASGAAFFDCTLVVGSVPGPSRGIAHIGLNAGSTLAGAIVLHEAREVTGPAAIKLRCYHSGTLSGTPRFDWAQLTAIRTENLQVQSG